MGKFRSLLVEQLRRHTPHDALETAMMHSTIRFVEQNEYCFDRNYRLGHITGSSWIVDADRKHALLTHHRKLSLWLQLGGHLEPGESPDGGALREAKEESGLEHVILLDEEIFDVDVHKIPARGDFPAHEHYDIRYLFEADRALPLKMSEESNQLAWVPIEQVIHHNADESISRMVRKTQIRFAITPPAERP